MSSTKTTFVYLLVIAATCFGLSSWRHLQGARVSFSDVCSLCDHKGDTSATNIEKKEPREAPWRWCQELRPKHAAAIVTKSKHCVPCWYKVLYIAVDNSDAGNTIRQGATSRTVKPVLTDHLPGTTAHRKLPILLLFHVHPHHRPAEPNKIPDPHNSPPHLDSTKPYNSVSSA
jgi:hypothetical protein